MMGRGRPSILTPEVLDRALKLQENGATIAELSRCWGVTESTMRTQLSRRRRATEDNKSTSKKSRSPPPPESYVDKISKKDDVDLFRLMNARALLDGTAQLVEALDWRDLDVAGVKLLERIQSKAASLISQWEAN